MRPTIRQLEYLVALASTLHFRKAAELAKVSQPGLSAQIRALEETLGVTLFERDRRHVLLTPAGEAAVERARVVLAGIDDLVAATSARSAPLTGTLRLGAIPTVGPYLLPEILPALRAGYPELRPLIREDHTDRLVAMLDAGELDVLLLALEAELGDAETEPLFEDPFYLVVDDGHPLAGRKRVRLDDLDGLSTLMLQDGH